MMYLKDLAKEIDRLAYSLEARTIPVSQERQYHNLGFLLAREVYDVVNISSVVARVAAQSLLNHTDGAVGLEPVLGRFGTSTFQNNGKVIRDSDSVHYVSLEVVQWPRSVRRRKALT
jgi:hypothetical protein